VVQGCREILRQLDRYQGKHRRPLAPLRGRLDGLSRELDRIQSIDYLKASAGARARALWETTAKRLRAAEAPRPPTRRPHPSALPARERPAPRPAAGIARLCRRAGARG